MSKEVVKRPVDPHEPIRGVDVTPEFQVSQQALYHTREGHELVSPLPIAPPLGYVKRDSLAVQIQRMVSQELSKIAADRGFETMEEADDFDVGDDFDPHTPYEAHFFPPTEPYPGAAEQPPSPTAVSAPPKAKEGSSGGAEGGAPAGASRPPSTSPGESSGGERGTS